MQSDSDPSADSDEVVQKLILGDVTLNTGTHEAFRGDKRIDLPKLSYQLLLALAKASPNMLNMDQLIDQVWPGRVVSPETVTQRVRLLRRSLGDNAQDPTYIGLVRGQGYRLLVSVEVADQETNESRSLVSELSRRRVLQVAALYVAIAWSLTEAVSFVIEALPVFPDGANRVVAILFVVGFPIAMFLAWQFDVDRQGGLRLAASSARGRYTMAGAIVLLFGSTAGLYYLIDPQVQPPVPARLPVAPANTVAVLPFVNASGDAGDDFISDGLGDELRDQLGRIAGLQVAARSSSMFFKEKPMAAQEIASKLGVRWLIESTFRKQGDVLRISVRIIDGATGFQSWSASLDHLQSDLLQAQQNIATQVVAEILPGAEEQVAATAAGSSDVSAQTLLLLGRHTEQKVRDQPMVDEVALNRAVKLYRQATEADPTSALAHSRLAGALLYQGNLDAAKEPLERALVLNPNLSDAHYSQGLYHWLRGDSAGGASYERAVALNPNNPLALAALAKWIWHNGVVDGAGELLRKARALDPLSLERYSDLGNYYGVTGHPDEALALARQIEEQFPNVPGYRVLSRIYQVAGDYPTAIAWAMRAKIAAPRLADIDWQLAELYVRVGDDAAAQSIDGEPSIYQLFFGRRYSELIDVAEELLFDNPNDLKIYYLLSFAYNTQSYYAEAARLLTLIGFPERFLSDARAADALEAAFTYASALQAIGREEDATEMARWLRDHMNAERTSGAMTAWWTNLYQACAHGILKEEEQMLERLEVIPASPGLVWYSVLKDAQCFQPYIANPRYLDVVEKVETRMADYRAAIPAALTRLGVPVLLEQDAQEQVVETKKNG
ncbi:MAG: TolB-like protein/DNA-binding winged helix-turn-helix (wHTH) protein [Halieaceae bacterium]|jgi:TolB-like protein/DNA-binding winged helix-turn-helix (wHTH) protein/Flp pilus assembly protein TadD